MINACNTKHSYFTSKLFLLLAVFLFSFAQVHANEIEYEKTDILTGAIINKVVLDESGATYAAGTIRNSSHYGSDSLYGVIIIKYDKNNKFEWLKKIADKGEEGYGDIVTDLMISNGKVYVSGAVTDEAILETNSSYIVNDHDFSEHHPFTAIYDLEGNYIDAWPGISGHMSTDSEGSIYFASMLKETRDLDISANKDIYEASSGQRRGHITKYNKDGTYEWTRVFGAQTDPDSQAVTNVFFDVSDMVIDDNDNVYITGKRNSEFVIFDENGAVSKTLEARAPSNISLYVSKYDKNGEYKWTKEIKRDLGYVEGFGLAVDKQQNILVIGRLTGYPITIETTTGNTELNIMASLDSNSTGSILLNLETDNGDIVWAKTIRNSREMPDGFYERVIAHEVAVGPDNGDIYVTGEFTGYSYLGGSSLKDNELRANDTMAFLSIFDKNGNFKKALTPEAKTANVYTTGQSVAAGNDGSLVYAGKLFGTDGGKIDFDHSQGIDTKTENGNFSSFLTQLNTGAVSRVDEEVKEGEPEENKRAVMMAKINELLSLIENLQQQLKEKQNGKVPFGAYVSEIAKTIGKGDNGQDVRSLQEFLAKNPAFYPEGEVTGYYGEMTEKAVRRYQCANNIVCTGSALTTGYGYVGPTTKAKMNEEIK